MIKSSLIMIKYNFKKCRHWKTLFSNLEEKKTDECPFFFLSSVWWRQLKKNLSLFRERKETSKREREKTETTHQLLQLRERERDRDPQHDGEERAHRISSASSLSLPFSSSSSSTVTPRIATNFLVVDYIFPETYTLSLRYESTPSILINSPRIRFLFDWSFSSAVMFRVSLI